MTTLNSITTTSAPSLSAEVNRPLLVFLGKAGAGKTSAAERLQRIDPDYRVVHFAQKLKDTASLLWGPDAFRNRGLLQWLGNTMREYDEDVWVNSAEQEIIDIKERGFSVTVDDCRFPNEVAMLLKRGAYFVRLECREEVRIDRLQRKGKFQNIEQLSDVTETALDEFQADFTIDTTGSDSMLEDLTDKVNDVYTRIRSVV